jgi:hypothetical protein
MALNGEEPKQSTSALTICPPFKAAAVSRNGKCRISAILDCVKMDLFRVDKFNLMKSLQPGRTVQSMIAHLSSVTAVRLRMDAVADRTLGEKGEHKFPIRTLN